MYSIYPKLWSSLNPWSRLGELYCGVRDRNAWKLSCTRVCYGRSSCFQSCLYGNYAFYLLFNGIFKSKLLFQSPLNIHSLSNSTPTSPSPLLQLNFFLSLPYFLTFIPFFRFCLFPSLFLPYSTNLKVILFLNLTDPIVNYT